PDDAVDGVDGAVEDAAAQAGLGALADDGGRGLELDARELCRLADEGLGPGDDTGRNDAADESAVAADAVEGRRGAEVDGDGVAAEECGGGDRVGDAVGADR